MPQNYSESRMMMKTMMLKITESEKLASEYEGGQKAPFLRYYFL